MLTKRAHRYFYLAAMTAAFLFAGTLAAQEATDLERGVSAYWSLNYDSAIELLTPLAELGDAEAAYYLALIHDPAVQQVEGFNAKYQADYHDIDQAWHWYSIAIQQGNKQASVRGAHYAQSRPFEKETTFHKGSIVDAGVENASNDPMLLSTHASRLSTGDATMPDLQRNIYREWRQAPETLDAESQYLYMMMAADQVRISRYITLYQKLAPGLDACGRRGDDLCYYYLGLIDLDAARKRYEGFKDKYLDAWVHFYLAEQMGNGHAAVYRYVLGEAMTEKEEKNALMLLNQYEKQASN